jgi:hypothetical protein
MLIAGIGLGMVLAAALPVAGGSRFEVRQFGAVLPDPIEELAKAQAAAPYDVKVPASLPSGTALEHVVWDSDIGGVVVVDIWFSLPAGERLHIWQTNTTSSIESIPEGTPTAIGGKTWSQVTVDWGGKTLIQLSTRFEDGVTVTIDAPLDALDGVGLAQVAQSIV